MLSLILYTYLSFYICIQFWKVTWEVFGDDFDSGAWVAYYYRCDIPFVLFDIMYIF
jgi:hypothetical protein